jgi:hypothetical protein
VASDSCLFNGSRSGDTGRVHDLQFRDGESVYGFVIGRDYFLLRHVWSDDIPKGYVAMKTTKLDPCRYCGGEVKQEAWNSAVDIQRCQNCHRPIKSVKKI